MLIFRCSGVIISTIVLTFPKTQVHPMPARLFIGNLPYSATENDLQDHFTQAGVVVSTKIMLDRMTGRSRGFGFVEMISDEDAQKAISLLNKQEFQGRPLTVDPAKPREERPPGAGAGGYNARPQPRPGY